MDLVKYRNKAEYKNFLINEFSEMLNHGAFNIFLHCVTPYNSYYANKYSAKEDVYRKVNDIWEKGLDLDGSMVYGKYGSINGTAKFFGEIQGVNSFDEIINYDYFSGSRFVNTIIFAIPKYININGSFLEFSSYNGQMKHRSQHVKDCLLDISKSIYLPPEFTFGYQIVDNDKGTVSFLENNRHFAKISEQEQEAVMKGFQDRIKSVLTYCKVKYGKEDFEEVFKIMTEEHLRLIDDFLNEP